SPSRGILDLPHVVVEALRAYLASEVSEGRVGKIHCQQAVDASGVTISNAQRIAELAHARIPAISRVEGDVAPTDSKVVHKVVADHSRPVANRVVNWRRRKAVRQQDERV